MLGCDRLLESTAEFLNNTERQRASMFDSWGAVGGSRGCWEGDLGSLHLRFDIYSMGWDPSGLTLQRPRCTSGLLFSSPQLFLPLRSEECCVWSVGI